MDSTTVRVGAEGLILETHPNKMGVSKRAVVSETLHQVGGLPRWRKPDLRPRCPECSMAMPFIASLDSCRAPFDDLDFGRPPAIGRNPT